MVLLATLAQSADLLSWSLGVSEHNPVVAGMGPWAVLAKAGLMLFLAVLGWRYGRARSVRFALALAVAVGVCGFLFNTGTIRPA